MNPTRGSSLIDESKILVRGLMPSIDLKELAETCNFCDCLHNSLIRDRIVDGVFDEDKRKLLLHERSLDVSKAINITRTYEETRQ